MRYADGNAYRYLRQQSDIIDHRYLDNPSPGQWYERGDYVVDMLDLLNVAEYWLTSGPAETNAWTDIEPDGIINNHDLSILASEWMTDERPATPPTQ